MKNQQEKALQIRLGLIVATMMGNSDQAISDDYTFATKGKSTLKESKHTSGPEDDDELEEDDDDFDEFDPLEEIPDDDDLEQEDERDDFL